MTEQFVVVCREDRQGRRKGRYTLATRRVFDGYDAAAAYARGISASREPLVVGGRWSELRQGE